MFCSFWLLLFKSAFSNAGFCSPQEYFSIVCCCSQVHFFAIVAKFRDRRDVVVNAGSKYWTWLQCLTVVEEATTEIEANGPPGGGSPVKPCEDLWSFLKLCEASQVFARSPDPANYSVFFNLNVLSVPGLLSLILLEYQDLSLSVVVFMTFKVLKSSSQK